MCETFLIATPEGQDVMHENTVPEFEDPIGPPMINSAAPNPDARNQALTGHRGRKDGLGTLIQTTTISVRTD
ncbi:hypothetical protein [Amycolatopsis sp. NBC_01286]|uniref:hypothetical protein n=1 Tax=Amycolatopsis sp. NBC_01286 TaxID=2903560 RepID=UPI002E0F8F5B|nr:hypothetical protein OG570_41580 [Amycolatopsis sp. NBC_01286]